MRVFLPAVAVASVITGIVAGCEEITEPRSPDAGLDATAEGLDAMDRPGSSGTLVEAGAFGSFNPDNYPTSCTEATDCIQVPHLAQCATCCTNDTAVSRTPAERDLSAAVGQCEEITKCQDLCPNLVPSCVDQRCALQ